jgi:site-specific DNA-cytosine methylase
VCRCTLQLGIEIIFQVEICQQARLALEQHNESLGEHPIKVYDVKDMPNINEHIDVGCIGFPCQDTSIAGGRLGTEGEVWAEDRVFVTLRCCLVCSCHVLYECFIPVTTSLSMQNPLGTAALEYVWEWMDRRIMSPTVKLPEILIFENVVGLLTCKQGGDGEYVLRMLYRTLAEKYGYNFVSHRCVDCACFKQPTMRQRCVVAAGRLVDTRHMLLGQVWHELFPH